MASRFPPIRWARDAGLAVPSHSCPELGVQVGYPRKQMGL